MSPLTGLAYVAPSGSPSLRYFESASREARRSLGEVWWGRADRRSETKSGREGVRRFCERRIVALRSLCPSLGAQTFCPSLFMVSSADGALPSVDSSPNTISLTCPSANTHFARTRCGLGSNRSELDTGLRPTESNGIQLGGMQI